MKIRANADTSGTISLRNSNILGCSFADATLFMNGTQAALGSFSDCFIPSVQSYHANLTFVIEPTYGEVREILVNGSKVLSGRRTPTSWSLRIRKTPKNPRLLQFPGIMREVHPATPYHPP